MREGMLQIRDVEGPRKTGSVETRLEAMEQQVFKCQAMVERGLNANHMMITEFTNKHRIDTTDIRKHLSRLYDRIDHLQAQIYDLQNQNCQLWSMHDKENEDRIRENLKLREEKRKMEEELRFFKHDFAKMVADKEEAINQIGSARLAMSDLKEEIEKKKLADHSSTNLHQVLRAKAEKERDQLVLERDQMKEEKKKMDCIISDMMKQNHGYKDKVKKLKEICDEF
ncbi:40S ribosomal protein S5-1 [Hordeum vulgare]|nr:40S ribosomal protein S5-1 [Hordeum vulgare]